MMRNVRSRRSRVRRSSSVIASTLPHAKGRNPVVRREADGDELLALAVCGLVCIDSIVAELAPFEKRKALGRAERPKHLRITLRRAGEESRTHIREIVRRQPALRGSC